MSKRSISGRLDDLHDWRLLVYFFVPTVVIFVLIIQLVRSDPVIGAALLGAGPPLLYAIYQELVNKPMLELRGTPRFTVGIAMDYAVSPADRQSLFNGELAYGRTSTALEDEEVGVPTQNDPQATTQVPGVGPAVANFDPFLKRVPRYMHPVIEVSVDIENTGRETARNCSIRAMTDGLPAYFGRWNFVNNVVRDVDPNSFHRLTFLRIFPELSERLIDAVEEAYDASEFIVSANPNWNFSAFNNRAQDEFNHILIDGAKFFYQIPGDYEYERANRLTYGVNPDAYKVFDGVYIEPKEHLEIELSSSASDWQNNVTKVKINHDEILSKLERWEFIDPVSDPAYRALQKLGWQFVDDLAAENVESPPMNSPR